MQNIAIPKPKISELKIPSDIEGFFKGKNFEYNFETNFSVITGVNGSGKTQLLTHIYQVKQDLSGLIIRLIDVDYKLGTEVYFNQIDSRIGFSYRIGDDGKKKVFDKNDKEIIGFGSITGNNLHNQLDDAIMLNIVKERRKAINQYLHDELDKIIKLEKQKLSHKEFIENLLPKDLKDDKPWDRIDRIFNDFDLSIRIDRNNLNSYIGFLKNNTPLELSQLSSGEKVAFALALWTWGGSTGQKTEVLLIDEFDAHLNPSIAEKFIEIIKKYFVDEGVQVIMTTHNPSTVAFSETNSAKIIWMQDGNVDKSKESADIIHTLSNGLINVFDLHKEVQLILEKGNKCTVYTEGKTDKIFIEKAICALCMEKDFEDIYIFGSPGANNVAKIIKEFFIKLPTDNKVKIALFDYDKKGVDCVREMESEKNKKFFKKVKKTYISDIEGEVIEDLFGINLINEVAKSLFEEDLSNNKKLLDFTKDQKNKIKNKLQILAEQDKIEQKDYEGFRPLLKKILDKLKI